MLSRSGAVLGGFVRGFQTSARAFASPADAFQQAQVNLKKLSEEPDNNTKLDIYAHFKQATSGDVAGSRPGMMDFVGRAKYDAWAKLKGSSKESAMSGYAKIVSELSKADAAQAPASTVGDLKPVQGLDISVEGKVFKITLNRPTKFNAITPEMYEGLGAALDAASKDRTTSVTMITGTGNFFCSGNDLKNFTAAATMGPAEVKEMAETAAVWLKKYVASYINHEKPLICAVNGPAIGIAVTVLPMFDLVLASDTATFNTPFAALGQSPEGCSSYTFPQLMGQLKASEVLLFGKKLSAGDAHELGLVNEVIPHADFSRVVEERVKAYSQLPPESLRLNKVLLRDLHRAQLHKANDDECSLIVERWQSKECAQAIGAFLARSAKNKK